MWPLVHADTGTAEETHLASVHINLLRSLLQGASLHVENQANGSSLDADQVRRLFWSVHILTHVYAKRHMRVSLLDDIHLPRYSYTSSSTESASMARESPPKMPNESLTADGTHVWGIWAYAVQMTSLWKEVRNYIALWREGEVQMKPWSNTSSYATITSRLMDIETEYPSQHRYDSAKFWNRSSDELENDRAYWSPWLVIQFSYHAIHTLLNHPFLYSARPSESPETDVPNSFWKTLSEKALTHSSWTIRLLDQALEKRFQIYDPFIGHCISIAATVHLYYCRSEDSGLQHAVQQRLAKCSAFLQTLAAATPLCRSMVSSLL